MRRVCIFICILSENSIRKKKKKIKISERQREEIQSSAGKQIKRLGYSNNLITYVDDNFQRSVRKMFRKREVIEYILS